jgi:peptidoglycan glycosyltransferase
LIRSREFSLLTLAITFTLTAFAALMVAPAARVAQWSAAAPSFSYLITILIFIACAVIGHVALVRRLPHRDPLLFPLVMFLSGWGLAEVWRLAPAFGLRQAMWLLISVGAMIVITYTPDDLRWLRRYRYVWLTAALTLTALTLIVGTNPSGGSQMLWLGCCGLYFQPSEALKLLFVMYLASYISENQNTNVANALQPAISFSNSILSLRAFFAKQPLPRTLRLLRRSPSTAREESPRSAQEAPRNNAATNTRGMTEPTLLAPILAVWGFSLLLLISQRDLGTGSLLFASFIAMLYLATNQKRFLIVGGLLLVVGGVVSYVLFDVVRLRVDSWIDPFIDPSGRSFQIVQSLIAIANGGLIGRGIGFGSPTVIPVVHSDFVFAALIEEWGLLGGAAVIAALAAFVMRGLRVAALATTTYRSLLAGGLSMMIGLQSILIIGGVIKALPLTGVTLPFISYGGSSLLINFLIVGLLLKLSDRVSDS